MTPNEILTALAAQDGLPRQAMAAAGERREEMIPIILDQIDRLLEAQTDALLERDVASFLFVYFLLGEWRDVRAYRPLTLLLRKDPALLDLLLGDAITEGTSRVIGGVCDGDIGPICAVIEDPAADEFVRSAMFNSLVIVAREQPTIRSEIASYMERFPVLDVAKPELLWGAWAFAVADLGLDHMEAQVREAFDAGRISPEEADFALFEAELQKSKAQDGAEVDPPSRELTLIENAIEELAGWHSFSDAYLRALTRSQLDDDDLSAHWGDTFQRETPKVGRNDPCPCGSSKKFKKCCLQ